MSEQTDKFDIAKARALAERIKNLFHGTHYLNLAIRRGGKDWKEEGDWLKECEPVLRAACVALGGAQEGCNILRNDLKEAARRHWNLADERNKAVALNEGYAETTRRTVDQRDTLARENKRLRELVEGVSHVLLATVRECVNGGPESCYTCKEANKYQDQITTALAKENHAVVK